MDKDIDERNNSLNNTYSSVGSLASRVDPLYAPYMLTYNAANQLTAIKNSSGTVIGSFTYDAAGNNATTTGEGAAAYTHDARNRLTEANITGGSNIYYTYDAQGRLIRRATSTTDIQYRYNDTTGTLMHELDADGDITVSYVSDSSGRIISVTRALNTQNPTTFFYHYNAHGDVSAISDSDGDIVATFTYDAWGVPIENGNPNIAIGTWTQTTGGTPGNGLFFLFGGMLYDAAAGLYLTKTRAYNPKTGRFLERDILDESGKNGVYAGFPFGKDAIGTNLYAWCSNNPVTRVDPSGESWLRDLFVGAARAFLGSPGAAAAGAIYAGFSDAFTGRQRTCGYGRPGASGGAAALYRATQKFAAPVVKVIKQVFNAPSQNISIKAMTSANKFIEGNDITSKYNVKAFTATTPDSCTNFGKGAIGEIPKLGDIQSAVDLAHTLNEYPSNGFRKTVNAVVIQGFFETPVIRETKFAWDGLECANDGGGNAPYRCMGCHARTGLAALHPDMVAQDPYYPWYYSNRALGYPDNW